MEAVQNFAGEALQEWRRKRGLSHDDLASIVNISRPNLIAYEKGRRRPSPPTTVALAAALRVAPSRLSAIHAREWTLADLRSFSGCTKADAAAALGVARGTYAAMETGRRRLRPDLIEPLAVLLECSPTKVRAAHRRSISTKG